jgi:MoaA/NifB/PqqE/SkfB family radical SAM enzyme
MAPGYKLSFAQLQACLADCRRLETIRWVHFSGGEPTLWKEKNRHLIDLLLAISAAGFTPGFTSNGSLFANDARCHEFFSTYFNDSTTRLRLYLSIDTFHQNFDMEKKRASSLDNVLKYREELPRADLLEISVIVIISKDIHSLLPEEMIHYYEDCGVTFGFVPLLPQGKAKAFRHQCPDLSRDAPENLGAFRSYYRQKLRVKREKAKPGEHADHINLIGNDYYFTDPWRKVLYKVAPLGQLPDEIIHAYR